MFVRNDRYLGIGCIVLGILAYLSASKWTVLFASDPAGPGGIPKILAAGFVIIGVIMIVGSMLLKDIKASNALFTRAEFILTLLMSAICLAYLIVLPYIGYLLATPLLIGGILYAVGSRNWKIITLVSVIGTLALFLMFYSALKVNLPLGFMKKFIVGLGIRW